jgi:hypothetical protein
MKSMTIMNSAALRFIPKEDLAKHGFGKYLTLFKSDTMVQRQKE